jgi:DNA-binding IclR family transcriptional regulator
MAGEIVDDRTVIGRALAIVDVVADRGPDVTLAELAAATGLPKPTLLRIANDLVVRRVLTRNTHGYTLGPELSRLGEVALRQREYSIYQPVLEELHAAHGGIAWLSAGTELASLRPVSMVCDRAFAAVARAKWPSPESTATPINTAVGHVVLAHRPDLLERVARTGMAPSTPDSPHDLKQLLAILHRARQEGVALESEQSMIGWSCAAARIPDLRGQLAVVGVTLQVGRANSRRVLRSIARALNTLTGEPASASRGMSRRRRPAHSG